jgi:hypothetical protein
MLFNPIHNKQQTLLAYKIRCYPYYALSTAAVNKIAWRKFTNMTRAELLESLNEDKTALIYLGHSYPINWQYGNVPTEAEWNKITGVTVDLRASPLLGTVGTAILNVFSMESKQ